LCQQKQIDMKTQFELKTWLSENRNLVIEKYNALTNEPNFNGITLKEFMTKVLVTMGYNKITNEKKALTILTNVMSGIYYKNCDVEVIINRDEMLVAKYENTAYMALV
jgi:predicted transport protein